MIAKFYERNDRQVDQQSQTKPKQYGCVTNIYCYEQKVNKTLKLKTFGGIPLRPIIIIYIVILECFKINVYVTFSWGKTPLFSTKCFVENKVNGDRIQVNVQLFSLCSFVTHNPISPSSKQKIQTLIKRVFYFSNFYKIGDRKHDNFFPTKHTLSISTNKKRFQCVHMIFD